MSSHIDISAPVPQGSEIDFVCYDERQSFPWLVIAQKFIRFTHKKYEDTAQLLSDFNIATVRKLHQALTTGTRPTMDDDDARLLNWLILRDFRDAYKLYTAPGVPTSPPEPVAVSTPAPASDSMNWALRRANVLSK